MVLEQDGQPVCSVSCYERRAPEPADGPALVWFEVPAGVVLNLAALHELVGVGLRQAVELLDYDAERTLVIAIEASAMT